MMLKFQKQPFADVIQNRVLKNLAIFTGKHMCWRAALLKSDFNTGVFLWILQNF